MPERSDSPRPGGTDDLTPERLPSALAPGSPQRKPDDVRLARAILDQEEYQDRLAVPCGRCAELASLRKVAGAARSVLLEQRREFARGELADLDALEAALEACNE